MPDNTAHKRVIQDVRVDADRRPQFESLSQRTGGRHSNSGPTGFNQFMKERERVAKAYVEGNAVPLDRIVTRIQPATFFGPQGGYTEGADDVFSKYKRDARAFRPGGDSSFEILQVAAGDDIAYWVGFQHAMARLQDSAEPVPMKLRVTEVFRREGGDWKLVHRHVDPLASESTNQSK